MLALSGEKLKIAIDPYFPKAGMVEQFKWLKAFGFSRDQLRMIRHGNALSLFSNLKARLEGSA